MGRTAHLGLFSRRRGATAASPRPPSSALGLAHLGRAPLHAYPGGERQLTLIARALAQERAIVVMDEPTANLDFGNQVRVLEHVEDACAVGIGVLLSTHDPDQAFLCADRVAMLHAGRLVRDRSAPAEVVTAESLKEIYGVEVDRVAIPGSGGRATHVCVPSLARHEPGGPSGR